MIDPQKLWDAFVEEIRIRTHLEETPKNFLGSVEKHRVAFMKAHAKLTLDSEKEYEKR